MRVYCFEDKILIFLQHLDRWLLRSINCHISAERERYYGNIRAYTKIPHAL